MMEYARTVRVGVEVTRHDSEWIPFEYRMFHCRSKDKGDTKFVPLSDWAAEEVHLLSTRPGLPGQNKIPVGGSARFWVQMRMESHRDYWGEYDSAVEILKSRRIK